MRDEIIPHFLFMIVYEKQSRVPAKIKTSFYLLVIFDREYILLFKDLLGEYIQGEDFISGVFFFTN